MTDQDPAEASLEDMIDEGKEAERRLRGVPDYEDAYQDLLESLRLAKLARQKVRETQAPSHPRPAEAV